MLNWISFTHQKNIDTPKVNALFLSIAPDAIGLYLLLP